jgi:serine/threonine protein kinase
LRRQAREYFQFYSSIHNSSREQENVLVETNKGVVLRALLFDFGASTIDTSLIPDELHRYAGTIIWTAPETLFGPGHYSGRVNTHDVGTRRDVWSFGHLCRWVSMLLVTSLLLYSLGKILDLHWNSAVRGDAEYVRAPQLW